MVLATPGAGKTVMAAVVAKYLFNENMIDFVVCFAPSVAVQKSMEATFSRIIGRPMHGVDWHPNRSTHLRRNGST